MNTLRELLNDLEVVVGDCEAEEDAKARDYVEVEKELDVIIKLIGEKALEGSLFVSQAKTISQTAVTSISTGIEALFALDSSLGILYRAKAALENQSLEAEDELANLTTSEKLLVLSRTKGDASSIPALARALRANRHDPVKVELGFYFNLATLETKSFSSVSEKLGLSKEDSFKLKVASRLKNRLKKEIAQTEKELEEYRGQKWEYVIKEQFNSVDKVEYDAKTETWSKVTREDRLEKIEGIKDSLKLNFIYRQAYKKLPDFSFKA